MAVIRSKEMTQTVNACKDVTLLITIPQALICGQEKCFFTTNIHNFFSKKNAILTLTLLLLNTTCPVLANSVDPDQLASEEEKPTDLDLHCLSLNT